MRWSVWNSSVGRKYVMAVTGSLLGCFLLVHAAGNSSIFWGREPFLSYARHLHSLGFLLNIVEILLLAVFLLHVITGLALFLANSRARGQRYAMQRSAGGRTLGSLSMPYTGLTILAFLLVHLVNFHFTDHHRPIADMVAAILGQPLYAVFYGCGLLALLLHISHGFWSLFQSLGISHPAYDALVRTSGRITAGLICAVFWGVVILLLLNPSHLVS